ncbi:MAG: hypothetical protein KBE91_08645 [Bacteroidia bacterium]|nr:hypothetical protein [Bacteroidia bacterium]
MSKLKLILPLFALFLLSACATYYQKNMELMENIYAGNFNKALKTIDEGKLKKQKRNKLLYHLNKGTLLFMNNQPVESNSAFQQADFFVEDYQKNIGLKAASFLTNASIQTYEGENFEKVLIHYYTTLNYLQLGLLDEALVECKRMEIKLTKITDYYKGKNKYQNDAFVYLLTGIVYDAQNDFNNAFIAYRNAYNIYKDVYAVNLNTAVPAQLKEDLIRTALKIGFTQEANQYKEEFKLQNLTLDNFKNKSSFVAFWNNGFGPVKDQWSINFTIIPGANGWVNFTNWDLGLSFPFYAGEDSKSISSLKVMRVAFPKYISRNPVHKNAKISIDSIGLSTNFEVAEFVDKIAYQSLQDRMLKEMGEALIRLAIKQVAAAQLRKENDALGSVLSIVNAATEQADTRNWQTLPYTISYTRLNVLPGQYTGKFTTGKDAVNVNIDLAKNRTKFMVFQSPYFDGYANNKE